jgi:hypothetical protein
VVSSSSGLLWFQHAQGWYEVYKRRTEGGFGARRLGVGLCDWLRTLKMGRRIARG